MLTEAEARRKWCPYARVSVSDRKEEGNHANNRWADEPTKGANCLGSGCMAWRMVGVQKEMLLNFRDSPTVNMNRDVGTSGHKYQGGWMYEKTGEDIDGRLYDLLYRAKPDGKEVGYCGLAGRPE